MKYYRFLFAINFLLLPLFANSQILDNKVIKIGGFVYTHHFNYTGYSINFELEKIIKNKEFLTHGPGIDYVYLKDFISKNIYLGYNIKFYPLYWIYRKPFRGLFIGIDPFFLLKDPRNDFNRYGPGFGTTIGYQIIFKDKISLSYELNINYFQNLNPNVIKKNNLDRYFGSTQSLKIGFTF